MWRHGEQNKRPVRRVPVRRLARLLFLALAFLVATSQAAAIPPVDSDPPMVFQQPFTAEVDPFVPFIKAPPRVDRAPSRETAPRGVEPLEEEPVFRTPLERLTLQEIRLVGIVVGGGRKLAVVEDPQGTFHDLVLDTAVGVNEGRVTDILEDRVIIVEKQRDTEGRIREQERILRLEGR